MPQVVSANTRLRQSMRAWKKSREGIDYLSKNCMKIAEMPQSAYYRHCEEVLLPLLAKRIDNPVRHKRVHRLIRAFETFRMSEQTARIPLCTSISPTALPRYRWISQNQVSKNYRQLGHFLLNEAALRQYQAMPKVPLQTKAELDAIVKAIRAETDLIPWGYMDEGCEQRARVVNSIFTLRGIPAHCLGKVYAVMPPKNGIWNFHVASLVTLADGNSYVVDPALKPDQALTWEDWVDLQRTKSGLEIKDLGLITLPSGPKRIVQYDPLKCAVFTTDTITSLNDFYHEGFGLLQVEKTKENPAKTLQELATFRCYLEKNWLMPGE